MLSPDHLHPYQRKALEFILDHPHCALWLGLGLGKTIVTLTSIERLVNAMDVERCLIIAPLRVASTVWQQEAARWSHTAGLRISICTGTAKQRIQALKEKSDVVVVNRENVVWIVQQCCRDWRFDMLVLDESSSFKSSKTKRWRALKKIRPMINRSVQLTGTPASNGLLDLWSQVYLLDQGKRLGRTKSQYKQRWFVSDYMGWNWTAWPGAETQIQEAVADICLSMKAEDYLNMPDLMISAVTVEAPKAAMAQYLTLEKDFILSLEDSTVTAASAAVLSNKLLQFSNGAIYDEDGVYTVVHDEKIEALKDIVTDNPGESLLVAYNYKSDLERLVKAFPEATVMDKRNETVEAWNNGEIKMLLVHPASAGHGLNLQRGGCVVVWFGLTWSLELYQQMNGRLYRQGQEQPVRIMHIVTEGMLDHRVMKAIEAKAKTQEDLLDAVRREYADNNHKR